MNIDFPTILSVGGVFLLCVFAVGLAFYGSINDPIEKIDSSISKNTLENDVKILTEINRQALNFQKNKDEEKFKEQLYLMQEKQKETATRYLGILIDEAYITEDFNFPFRDVSEVKIIDPQSQKPVCDIIQHIPDHMKKIKQSDMFLKFIGKYSANPITLEISDERNYNSLVHYSLIATSEDKKFSASTYFHIDSCTDEKSGYYNLHCRNTVTGEFTHTSYKKEVIASLDNEEFCSIYLEPWRQDLLDYSKKIDAEQKKHFEKLDALKDDPNFEKVMKFNFELERFVMLGKMIDIAMDADFDSKTMQELTKEYSEKYGNVPEEFLKLIKIEK